MSWNNLPFQHIDRNPHWVTQNQFYAFRSIVGRQNITRIDVEPHLGIRFHQDTGFNFIEDDQNTISSVTDDSFLIKRLSRKAPAICRFWFSWNISIILRLIKELSFSMTTIRRSMSLHFSLTIPKKNAVEEHQSPGKDHPKHGIFPKKRKFPADQVKKSLKVLITPRIQKLWLASAQPFSDLTETLWSHRPTRRSHN